MRQMNLKTGLFDIQSNLSEVLDKILQEKDELAN